MSRKILTKHKVYFQYAGQSIPTFIYTRGVVSDIRTILYLGTLQVGYLPKIIASYCPNGTAIVQGAPHWRADKSGETIPDFMWQFTEQTYEFIVKKQANPIPINIIAESQAAPGVLHLALTKNDEIGKIVLLQPLGLNSESYGTTARNRYKTFTQRIRKDSRYQLRHIFTDAGLIINHLILLALGLREGLLGRPRNQYAAGLSHNSLDDLSHLYNKITIIVGGCDQLFPYDEIANSLENLRLNNISLMSVDGIPHSPLASKSGRILLETALKTLETT